jgi:uncharacterized protein (TIGR02246 family)
MSDALDSPGSAMLRWAERFNTRDPAQVTSLYAEDALLFGTSKSKLYVGKQEIGTYFSGAATVKLSDQTIRNLTEDTALCVGTYLFSRVTDGIETAAPARFTFVLKRQEGRWEILHHHSSANPEK